MSPAEPVVLIIPCYNEAARIDVDRFRALATDPRVRLLFVDDGSTDGTWTVLERLAAESPSVEAMALGSNRGKGEAVRRGLSTAILQGATAVGYYDADLATPEDEMLRLVDVLLSDQRLRAVLAARVSLLGAEIERSAFRHYAGRVFASVAAVACGVRIYDTQCGAKVFRTDACLEEALSSPFRSRWSFDVELIARLMSAPDEGGPQGFVEVPLRHWVDVPGSNLKIRSMLKASADLIVLGIERRLPRLLYRDGRRRRRSSSSSARWSQD